MVVAQHSAAAGGVAAAHRPPALRPARPQPVHCGGHQPARAAAARRCTSTTGQHWEETCTLWQDGHRYAVEVDVTDYPYPLRAMAGLWQVDPHPMGSRVSMRFAYRAAPSTGGGLFTIALRALTPLALRRIFAGWRGRTAVDPTGAPVPTPGHRSAGIT